MAAVTQNLHTHSTFCDGKNTIGEMARAAYDAGFKSLGFSSHAFTPHDTSYCMKLSDYESYRSEILRLREQYKGRMDIFVGLEQDYFAVKPTIKTDYLIGSVHYVEKNGEYIPVDETREDIERAVSRLYGGDIYAFLEDYFALVSDVKNRTYCDIAGHIDLCEKFNGDGTLFDRTHPRYTAAYRAAVKKLCAEGCTFEINTGAMSRGYTDFPYPNESVLRFIRECGGRIILSSDSHSADTVGYKLAEMCSCAAQCGFTERYELSESGGFAAVKL